MRKLSFIVVFMSVVVIFCFTSVGCTEKKVPAQDSVSSDTLAADTAAVDSAETLIAEVPMPKAADELFDDFIFNFAANKKLQFARINFPLPVYQGGKVSQKYARKQWRMEHFFMRQDYYTLILDNMRELDAVKDTTINKVVVEKIYLRKNSILQYRFNRINGKWMLTSLNHQTIEESSNGDFLRFYDKFATDSAFQQHHLENPVLFTGPDPDDDFASMSGEIIPDTWPAFAPQLPSGMIYNIRYGAKEHRSKTRIFVMRGIANGMEMWLTFRYDGEKWLLTKLNT